MCLACIRGKIDPEMVIHAVCIMCITVKIDLIRLEFFSISKIRVKLKKTSKIEKKKHTKIENNE